MIRIVSILILGLTSCILLNSCSEPSAPPSSKQQTFQGMMQEYDATFVDVPKIDIQGIENLPEDSFVLIDIREPEEREVSWIPGSISLDEFEKKPESYKDRLLIPYCTIGYRSAYQTRIFNNQGYRAKNFKGSILIWAWHEKPLINKKGPTKEVHVYGQKWDLLPEGYHAIYE